jgi:hypothetical protein
MLSDVPVPIPVPDIHSPVPDLGHESLRRSVVAALDRIEAQIERLDRVFLLLLGTGHAMQGTLNVAKSGQSAIAGLQQNQTGHGQGIAALQQEVADQAALIATLQQQVAGLLNPP